MSDYENRFGGVGRLLGAPALARLRATRVMVIGLGGVGSWTAEALARSGVGTLILVDLDDVCVSNMNRQLHALTTTVGMSKVEVMAERLRSIHPEGSVLAVPEFYTSETSERLLGHLGDPPGGWVVDAIDAVANKCRLIAECQRRGISLITCGGAGGRSDPTRVRVVDLAQVTHDRLLSEVRRRLRRDFGFPREERRWRIPAVFSEEPPQLARPDGVVCAADSVPGAPGESRRLNCDHGFGSAAFVTGAFGLVAAAHVVRSMAGASASDHSEPGSGSAAPLAAEALISGSFQGTS